MDSDNESCISSDQGGEGVDDSDEDVAEFEPILEDDDDGDSEEAEKQTKKEAKKAREKEKRRAIRNEILELRLELGGLDNKLQNPSLGETLADFYTRTAHYWNKVATKSTGKLAEDDGVESISTKEMNQEGFNFAKKRHKEVKQILDRLGELEILQNECEEKRARKKAEKKLKKDRSR